MKKYLSLIFLTIALIPLVAMAQAFKPIVQ